MGRKCWLNQQQHLTNLLHVMEGSPLAQITVWHYWSVYCPLLLYGVYNIHAPAKVEYHPRVPKHQLAIY